MKKQFHFIFALKSKIYTYVIILFSVACVENNAEINNLFKALEKQIDNEKLLTNMKNFHQDSSNVLLPFFSPQYRHLKGIYLQAEEDTFTDSSLFEEEIMLFAFQKYLNRQPIDLEVIQGEVKEIKTQLKMKRDREDKLYKERLEEIIRTNDFKWQEGDTINVLLQIDYGNGYNSIYYRGYPASLDYSFADDTLKIKGLIKKKIYPETTDYLDIIFRLKILELNRKDVHNFVEKIKVEEEFDLHLESYARLIQ